MKHIELNNELVGKRVKGICIGVAVTGTITAVFSEYNGIKGDVTNNNAHCKGVTIELDKPVNWGGEYYHTYDSTERVMPQKAYNDFAERKGVEYAEMLKAHIENGFGNLKYTTLL